MLKKGSLTSRGTGRGGGPARDLIASIEWKEKPPVNEKADLLQVEQEVGSQREVITFP